MQNDDLILAIAGPATAILFSMVISKFEERVVEKQCDNIAIDKQLETSARDVMKKTASAAVVAMSFFPSFVAFTVNCLVLLVKSATPIWFLTIVFMGAIAIFARPLFMIWSRSLYELHDRAPRLFSKSNSQPSKNTFLDVIKKSIFYFNITLITITIFIYFNTNYPNIMINIKKIIFQ